jgi:hypothetical protein
VSTTGYTVTLGWSKVPLQAEKGRGSAGDGKMEKFGVFKRSQHGNWLFVSWAENLEASKKQIEDLANSNGNCSYYVQDFRRHAEVFSWSPAHDIS